MQNLFFLPFCSLDINECQSEDYLCEEGESCVNTEGSYRCERSCPQGEERGDNGDCKGEELIRIMDRKIQEDIFYRYFVVCSSSSTIFIGNIFS